MINLRDHEEMLRWLGKEYFVESVEFVPSLGETCKDLSHELGEPGLPMTVMAGDGSRLKLLVQAEVPEDQISGVIRACGVRWALKDTRTDVGARLDSTKKRLGFCFLKDYSRTVPNVGGDELREDEWVLGEMERLGMFLE